MCVESDCGVEVADVAAISLLRRFSFVSMCCLSSPYLCLKHSDKDNAMCLLWCK